MNAVKTKIVDERTVPEGGIVRQFNGKDIADVQTRFFFSDNLLCFQVLLEMSGGEKIFFKEFKDYSEYINTLKDLRKARSKGSVITVPKKIDNSGFASPNVA